MTDGTERGGAERHGWSAARIAICLYPFGAGAMAVNMFFLSLMGHRIGLPVLSVNWSIGLGCLFGIPATWVFARHIRALMDRADMGPG